MILPDNKQVQPGVVKRMREIRDEIGLKIMNMTWEEQLAFFRKGTEEMNELRKQQESANETNSD